MSDIAARLFEAIDQTWPARRRVRAGPWWLRDGDGGGKRVSAASAVGTVAQDDIADAERAMAEMGQEPLFMLRPEQRALDHRLAARGYVLVDPVTVYACRVATLADIPIPPVTVFEIWEPLAIMTEIWEQGGIGPARLRVMARAQGPKTGLFCRMDDRPAGVAFAARHGDTAMVHAVEVLPEQRRKGAAVWMMRAAAIWAARQDARRLAVLCTKTNLAANALYRALGFAPVAQYHYRIKRKEPR